MKANKTIFLLQSAVGAFILLAAPTAPAATAAAQHAPHIVCDAPVYDFGRKDNRQLVEHTFVLRNTGDISLEIQGVHPACGCTVARIARKTIPPGESTELSAKLNLRGRKGRVHKTITVNSNDPSMPALILALNGVAVTEINVNPDRVFLGTIPSELETNLSVEISSTETSFLITNITCNSPFFEIANHTVESGHVYRLTVSTKPPMPATHLRANIRLYTDNPHYPHIDVPVIARVLGPVSVAPTELILARVGGRPVTRYIIVTPGQVKNFTISKVVTPLPSITTSIVPMPAGGYRIVLGNLVPDDRLNGTSIRLLTDIAGMPEITIPIRILP